MMNCQQATQLLSEKLDRPLDTKEKISLGVHTTLCPPCRRFAQQMEELRSISKRYTKDPDDK
ncbi:zf-HC2 domain-containing protein [Marinomonas pollencensis]|uniref:Putative zinc finger protein n=1 Tax=Marinomonas pollencensis TaxID=491954 RepID=A0A3E0DM50_9GAMM|nr:zf-HC2 domain-containing protein [Marinomonas pollencensis]REG83737.1 putative zinc finger protein [Marinomonas pollencensis]